MKILKRYISLILLACMLVTVMPASAGAEENQEPAPESTETAGSAGIAEQEITGAGNDSGKEIVLDEQEFGQAYIVREGSPEYYETLYLACEDAEENETIVLCADAELSSRLTVGKSITITDDGTARSIYCCNTATDKAGGYGRGIQINGGNSLSVCATEAGNLTITGYSKDGATANAKEAINIYSGKLILSGVKITGCPNAAVKSYVYTNSITIADCIFENNGKGSCDAADISNCSVELNNITADDIAVPADCTCTLGGKISAAISLATGYSPITIGSDFSNESDVTLILTSAAEGDTVLTGSVNSGNCKCFRVTTDDKTYSVESQGMLEALKVARYVNSNGKTAEAESLSDAIANAKAGSTVTILADCNISSRIVVDKNITITDDGTHRTIYAFNSDSSDGSGRALQIQGSKKKLTISGTDTGGLTFAGHNEEKTIYNKSSILYAYSGTLALNNVEICESRLTYGSGVICLGLVTEKYNSTATAELDGCYIHDNTSTSKNGGTAVYVYTGSELYLRDGTVIEKNSATSSVSGAIYNEISDSEYAVTHISGNVAVRDNRKSCTKQEDEDIAHDGKISNIQLSSPDSFTIDGSIAGEIGIDYPGNASGTFGSIENETLTGKDCLTEDSGNYSKVTYDSDGNLYWHLVYSINAGDITDKSEYSYRLGNADVAMTSISDSADVISITADCGNFSIPELPEGCSSFEGVKNDGTFTDCFNAADKYRGISVYAELSETVAEAFIRNVTFTTPGEGTEQTVSIGLYAGAGAVKYYGGSVYSFCSDASTFQYAKANAENTGRYLAVITSSAENSYLKNTFGNKTGWIGAVAQYGKWCWADGPEEGAAFGGNVSSSEGYGGAYANWAEGEPDGEGCCAYMDGSSGKWNSSDGNMQAGYYQEYNDSRAVEVKTSISVPGGVTRLNAMSPSFDGDIGMYYYFSFADSIKTDTKATVSVTVGGGASTEYKIRDIIKNGGVNDYGDFRIKVTMSAKQMNDDVAIKIFDGSGNQVGSYGGAGRKNYNLRYYAERVIQLQSEGGSDRYNENFSYDIVQMVKAMLNYGAAAQIQFGYNTENPANKGFEDGVTQAPETIDNQEDAVYINGDNSVFTEAALIAGASTILRIYLSSDYSAKVDGTALSVKYASGRYYIDIPVSAQNLSHIYSIEANEKNLQINAYYIINGLLSSESADEESRLTAYRLYLFGKRADSYYGVKTISASAADAVVNTAYAFLNKSQFIQYDQKTIVKTNLRYSGVPNWRRQVRVYPENATGEINNLYMDCSSFIWNVYCDVFGTETMQDTLGIEENEFDTEELSEVSNDTVVKKYDLTSESPSVGEILSILQPGDIIVKRNSSHGHVVIWVGNGYIHCTGSSYSYNDTAYTGSDKTEDTGAIKYASSDTFSEAWWNGFETLSILRPLKVLNADNLSSYGRARAQTGAIAVSKTAFVDGEELCDGLSVNPGDTVTYRITLSNPTNKGYVCTAVTVDIKDTDPSGGIHAFSGLTVEPGTTETVEYTYTVGGTAGGVLSGGGGQLSIAGGQGKQSIDDGRGMIEFTAKSVAIEEPVSDKTVSKLEELATGGEKTNSGILYVNELMTSVTGKTVSLAESDSALFSDLFEIVSSGGTVARKVNSSMKIRNYLVSNYASGRMVINCTFNDDSDDFSTCRRVRNISVENLQKGDIVAVNTDGSTYLYYIYIGEQSMLEISGTSAKTVSNADTVLDGLLAKYSFAVLRVLGR